MNALLRFCAACCVASLALGASPPDSADSRFVALYTADWKWQVEQFGNPDGKHIDPHLPKVDAATQAMRTRYWQDLRKAVVAIPRSALSPAQQINYDVYLGQIDVNIEDESFRTYEMPANSDSNFWSFDYSDTSAFKTLDDYERFLNQLREIPQIFDDEMDNMRSGLGRGFTPPRLTLQGRDASIADVVKAKPEDTPLYKPFKEMPGIAPTAQAQLRMQARSLIATSVQPAYAKLLAFWDGTYVAHARTTLAAAELPNGAAFYRSQIREYTTLDMDAADIHRLGEAEVAKLHQQMLDVMKETGFKGDFPAFLAYLRTEPKFYAKTPQELLNDAAWIAKRFDGQSAKYFGLKPRQRFAIVPVPAEIAPFYTAGRGGPGVYLLNTYDLPHRPLYNLTALTLHESAPGHAWQIPLAAEDKSLPDFRRYSYISAYGEGWALYCEWLGQEMGMYDTPYDRFGMLSYQVWRAARLVVDTGIHSQGWTRERAIAYMRANTALPDHEIETEVDRYITWPGQALSYYLGEMTIRDARAKAERELGPRFNIRAFHDVVLSLGSVPMPTLQARVDQFIADGGQGPDPDDE